MILDSRTIILCLVINIIAVGATIVAYAAGENMRVNRALRVFGLGNITVTVGWLLIALRGYIPLIISVAVGNLLLMYGVGEFYQALRIFNGLNTRRRWASVIFVLGALFNIIFLYVWDDYNARVVGSSFILAGIECFCAYTTLRIRSVTNPVLRWVSFGTFTFTGLLNIVRVAFTLIVNQSSPNGQALLENSPFQSIFYASIFLGSTLLVTSFTLMCQDFLTHQFKQLSTIDPLTNLYNRREFEILALAAINHSLRLPETLCMLLADADDFKHINDTYGHEAGDAALKHLAELLHKNLRAQDTIGRFGGDEFAILLPGLSQEQGRQVIERIYLLIAEAPLYFNNAAIPLSFSIGLAVLNPERPYYNDLLHQADVSLYAQKRARLGQ